MNAKEQLDREIEELERKLAARKRARMQLVQADAESGDESMRFYKKRSGDVAESLLANGPRKREEVVAEMIAGGITIYRKRSEHNIRIGIDMKISLGKILERGEWLALPQHRDKLYELTAV